MSVLLWPAARLWSLAARTRVRLYASGTWRQQRLDRPVVSVGNLSVGGAGKTPFVIWLFSALVERGLRPAVLTRGYRRPAGEETLLFTRAGHGAAWTPDAVSAGDEVQVMLRHGLAPVGVDGNRLRAGRALEAKGAVDLHLLDDGFQHLALGRDLDIVLVDSTRPPWEDDLLPAGRLRESPSALRRAGVIVLTRVQDWTARGQVEARLRGVAPQAEIYRARHAPDSRRRCSRAFGSRPGTCFLTACAGVLAACPGVCGCGQSEGLLRRPLPGGLSGRGHAAVSRPPSLHGARPAATRAARPPGGRRSARHHREGRRQPAQLLPKRAGAATADRGNGAGGGTGSPTGKSRRGVGA